jgi:plasmid stabilization system protein ParE
MKARVLDEASLEFEEAVAYYESKSTALGERFRRAVHRTFVNVIEHPTMWSPLSGEYRRCRVNKFPYGIVYRVGPEGIVVVAVMHLKRRPGYWEGRA